MSRRASADSKLIRRDSTLSHVTKRASRLSRLSGSAISQISKNSEKIYIQERDQMVKDIYDEAFNAAFAIVYEKYIDNISVVFAVHTSSRAILDIVGWNYLQRDPGETVSDERVWCKDTLPRPSEIDLLMEQGAKWPESQLDLLYTPLQQGDPGV